MGASDPIRTDRNEFMNYLEKIGFIVLTRPLANRSDGTFEQKQIDVSMTLYIDWRGQSKEFDVAIIVSSDADFVIAMNFLKDVDKSVIVWSWRNSMSQQLLDAGGKVNVYYIDDIWDKIRINKR
ncbi:MAG: NYN domain-containing protein [Candidatus Thorarchaeota archaeon]